VPSSAGTWAGDTTSQHEAAGLWYINWREHGRRPGGAIEAGLHCKELHRSKNRAKHDFGFVSSLLLIHRCELNCSPFSKEANEFIAMLTASLKTARSSQSRGLQNLQRGFVAAVKYVQHAAASVWGCY
jgi:hypothetical protein